MPDGTAALPLTFKPNPIIGDPMFKLLQPTVLSIATLASFASWGALPESGMWSFDDELDGKPGRGLQIDRQGGSTVIVTYFGYRPDGSAMFLQASGKLANDRLFRGDLMEFRNGRTVGGPPHSAEPDRYHGEIKIDFANTTSGTVQLPNDGARSISRFVFENNLHWFKNEFRIMIGPNKQAIARFDINGDRMKLTYESQAMDGPDSSTAGSCAFDGSFQRSGRGYRSEGTLVCTGNLIYTGAFRIEDLAVDEYGALTAASTKT